MPTEGNSVELTGAYLSAPKVVNSDVSVVFWIDGISNTGNNQVIFETDGSVGDSLRLYLDSNGHLNLTDGTGNNINASSVITDASIHSIGIIWGTANLFLVVDGVQVGTWGISNVPNFNNIYFGANQFGAEKSSMKIDNIAIFDKELTVSEVNDIHVEGTS